MIDSCITLDNDELPGLLFFHGYRSVSHFLQAHQTEDKQIEINILGSIWLLPVARTKISYRD